MGSQSQQTRFTLCKTAHRTSRERERQSPQLPTLALANYANSGVWRVDTVPEGREHTRKSAAASAYPMEGSPPQLSVYNRERPQSVDQE